jgi:DNA-binding beta-propeller fold protein YncE
MSNVLKLAAAGSPSVSANAWDLAFASYDSVSVSVDTYEPSVQGLHFKPDGTKMFVVGNDNDQVIEYSLSSAWDISTASYVQVKSVSSQGPEPRGLFFKPDGTKMYTIDSTNDRVYEYSLSTAWDISTLSFVRNFSISGQESTPEDLFFRDDGLKMYITGQSGDEVNEYDLSVAWDISTLSFVQNFSLSGQESQAMGLFFSTDGTKMYITGIAGDDINQYSLSTAWNISTASHQKVFSVSSQTTAPRSVYFRDDGLKFFVAENADTSNVLSYSIT